MKETLEFLARHDYWVPMGAVLARQACLPAPANLILVAAGALAHSGRMNLWGVLALSVVTFLFADLAWYEAGRQLGEKILHFACAHSHDDSHSCVDRAKAVFSKHGCRTLLFSKFVIGFDAVAAPLAGMARVPVAAFLAFDGLGAAFWSLTYIALGYIFSDQLDRVAAHLAHLGVLLAVAAAVIFCFYMWRRFIRWSRFARRLKQLAPEQLRGKLNGTEISDSPSQRAGS